MKNIISSIIVFYLLFTQAFAVVADTPKLNINIEEEKKSSKANQVCHQIVRRAAFDIGSGQIKMQVSDVDIKTNKIVTVLLTDTAKVGLREDLSKSLDARLSTEIQNKMVDAIYQLMQKAAPFKPEEYQAVATETLRIAENANTLIERIKKETGLPVNIISQDEEGILGFISATSDVNVNPKQLVSWDFGGASFQITAKCEDRYIVYQGKLGKVPFKNALLKIQSKDTSQGQMFSPNPISKIDMEQAVQFIKDSVKNIPVELCQKLRQPDSVVLGIGIPVLWGIQKNATYDKEWVLKEIEQRLNLDDHAIIIRDSISPEWKETSAYVVSNLILVYGIMDALNIRQVKYVGTEGANAIGELLSPKYWKQREYRSKASELQRQYEKICL